MARPTDKQAASSKQSAWTPNMDWGLYGSPYYIDTLPPRPQLVRDLYSMVRSDETCGAMMYCINTAVANMPWKHVGCVDGVVDERDPAAVEAAHFADSLLTDMRGSWESFIVQAMTIVWAGLAPFEIVVKRRDGINSKFNDGKWGVDRLVQIDPNTIMRFIGVPKTDIVTGIMQSGASAAEIPIWKILHIRNEAYLDNPWGEPLLAPAWRPWKLKTRIQNSEALGIERELVGLPMFRIPQDNINAAMEVDDAGAPTDAALRAQSIIANAKKAVSQTRLGPTDGLILPSDTWSEDQEAPDRTPKYDFKLVTGGGQRAIDARTAARDYDRSIMRVAMMQFLGLGDRAGGSYGLSDDQSSIAMRAIGALAKKPTGEWNTKVLPLLWVLMGMDVKYLPSLKPGDIGKEGLTAVGAFLRGVGAVESLWSTDTKARTSILRSAGLEFSREDQTSAADSANETAQATLDKLNEPTPAPMAPPRAANVNKNLVDETDDEEEA